MERGEDRRTPHALGTRWNAALQLGSRWNSAVGRMLAGLTATLVALSVAAVPGLQEQMAQTMERTVSVIVRELPGSGDAPERAVADLGGSVERHIGIIDGFVATVPADEVRTLRDAHGVHSVTENRPMQLLSSNYSHTSDQGSLLNTAKIVGANELWKSGVTGKGVDVALIDTGVVPVNGLTYPGKVVNGPDLSFESQSDDLRYMDTMGHGTHMAGIIAGRDDASVPGSEFTQNKDFLGIAPDARIVSVKVANAVGATDVSQVLAAIDWVVQHRNDDGMNIRVLNLSFGTDGTQSYLVDPLTYAVEVAWRKGIVVVAAAGNSGYGNAMLNNPAYDPHVLAVGAVDTKGSGGTQDDIVPDWSSKGDGVRNPDVVAPGKSVVSLRAPGSYIDDVFGGTGYVDERFFRGSGTSQSAAVVSGAAALLLQQRPGLSPDQVKHLLRTTADKLPYADPVAQGSGEIDLKDAASAPTPPAAVAMQPYPYGDGTGSLHLARGTAIVEDGEGNQLTGEQNIFGDPWDGRTWADLSWDGRTWAGGDWLGRTWAGRTWAGRTWAGRTWAEAVWDGRTWAGRTWADEHWFGKTWAGRTWAGDSWDGRTWAGRTWAGRTWAEAVWDGRTWAGRTWADDHWFGKTWAGRTWAGRTWAGRTWADETWSGRTWAGVSWS